MRLAIQRSPLRPKVRWPAIAWIILVITTRLPQLTSRRIREVRLQCHVLLDPAFVVVEELDIDLMQLAVCLLDVIKLLEAMVAALPQDLEIQIEHPSEAVDERLNGDRLAKHASDAVNDDFRERSAVESQDGLGRAHRFQSDEAEGLPS